jgi:hypothetical protein
MRRHQQSRQAQLRWCAISNAEATDAASPLGALSLAVAYFSSLSRNYCRILSEILKFFTPRNSGDQADTMMIFLSVGPKTHKLIAVVMNGA